MNIYALISNGIMAHYLKFHNITISDNKKQKTYNSDYNLASCKCTCDGIVIEGEDGDEVLFELDSFQIQ